MRFFFADRIGSSLTFGLHIGRFGVAVSLDWGWVTAPRDVPFVLTPDPYQPDKEEPR